MILKKDKSILRGRPPLFLLIFWGAFKIRSKFNSKFVQNSTKFKCGKICGLKPKNVDFIRGRNVFRQKYSKFVQNSFKIQFKIYCVFKGDVIYSHYK